MSDTKLRELERRWKETGAPADEAALIAERVRAGELARSRVELAGFLRPSDPPGLLVTPFDPRNLQLHLRRLADLALPCGREAWARLGLAVVRRALPVWLRRVPEGHEEERILPFRLFSAVRHWLLTGDKTTISENVAATFDLKEQHMFHPGGHENHAPTSALAAVICAGKLVLVREDLAPESFESPSVLLWNVLVDGSLSHGLRHGVEHGRFQAGTDTFAGHSHVMFVAAEELVPWALGSRDDPVRSDAYLAVEGAPPA
jgi:hypothetical protein